MSSLVVIMNSQEAYNSTEVISPIAISLQEPSKSSEHDQGPTAQRVWGHLRTRTRFYSLCAVSLAHLGLSLLWIKLKPNLCSSCIKAGWLVVIVMLWFLERIGESLSSMQHASLIGWDSIRVAWSDWTEGPIRRWRRCRAERSGGRILARSTKNQLVGLEFRNFKLRRNQKTECGHPVWKNLPISKCNDLRGICAFAGLSKSLALPLRSGRRIEYDLGGWTLALESQSGISDSGGVPGFLQVGECK